MSYILNPQQVKRREYLGLIGMLSGLLFALAGLICLVYTIAGGLTLLGIGVLLSASGIYVLNNIPDVIGPRDELW